MKTLFLLRHAKSSRKDETLPDFDRPLNSRGRKAAEAVGAFLEKEKLIPDLVLSSSAVRARETTVLVLRSAMLQTTVRFDDRIYEATPDRLLEVVTQIEETINSALLVGHNPGMEQLIMLLTGKAQVMSTAALARITFQISDWSTAGDKAGILDWTVRPEELESS